MARRRRGRRRKGRNFVAIPFSMNVTLGTLSDGAVNTPTGFATMGEDIYCISMDVEARLRGLTAGQLPIGLVAAHGDLTAAEIQENLDASLSDPDDIIAREQARRPVRRIDSFNGYGDPAAVDVALGNGSKIRQKLGFSVGDGHFLAIVGHNRSGAALTSGGIVAVDGTLYGRWQR